MKLVLLFLFPFYLLFAHTHEPHSTISTQWEKGSTAFPLNVEVGHQSTFDLEDGNIFILDALFKPQTSHHFYADFGVGYRKLFDNIGIGCNFVYSISNSWGFRNHQFSPGAEIFYDHFSLAYNRYIPLKRNFSKSYGDYQFHNVSELCFSYRPSKKYEFTIAPYFNHSTQKIGYRGSASAYAFTNWKFSLMPFCEPRIKSGVAFSIGFHFGGAKSKSNLPFQKTHRFYTSRKAQLPYVRVAPTVAMMAPALLASSEPVIIAPQEVVQEVVSEKQPEVIIQECPIEEVKVDSEVKGESEVKEEVTLPPKESKTWTDFLFFWRARH
jgi:hypothetical protein